MTKMITLSNYMSTETEGTVSNKEINESNAGVLTMRLELTPSSGKAVYCHGTVILNDLSKKEAVDEFAVDFASDSKNTYEFWGDYNERATKQIIDKFLKVR